ncbi:MAG: NADH-quinone oxidoreductase subunit NuoG [Nitrospinae bacterium]|nr:NADH-quinone oxidoreductase subunit NuoG [Nitrospinota bacterium]
MSNEQVTFVFNDQSITMDKSLPVLEAALRIGAHVPHFCYHKNLSIVGQCRACLVEVLDAGNGRPIPKLQPSCATYAAEGMVISSVTPRVIEAQEGVFEFLLKNHPLDCPVCDQGGECPLQDQTMAYGKAISRTHEFRRIYPPKEMSPFIKPEMNRCVHCTRCIRFTEEIDGGAEFGWAQRGDKTEVGIYEDLPLTSIVSGNVIDICPVGALTDNKYRFTARVWEMQETQGPCTLCSVGCRQGVWTKDGEIKRVTAAENEKVNDTWICDVARFGWSGAHGEGRITQPMIRKDGELTPVGWAEAIGEAERGLGSIIEEAGGGAIAGLGGAHSTNETAYQFGAFMRSVLGTNHVDSRIHPRDIVQTDLQRAALDGVGGAGSIEALGRSKAVIIVGSDPFTQHPILALQIRKAHRAGAVVVNVNQRRIDLRVQSRVHHLVPVLGGISRTLRALAICLADGGAKPEGENAEDYAALLGSVDLNRLCEEADVPSDDIMTAARATLAADGPVSILSGPGETGKVAVSEAINLGLLLRANMLFAAGAPNLQGAIDMGLHPESLPGGDLSDEAARAACAEAWGRAPGAQAGRDARGILDGLGSGELKGLYVLGCDPVAEHPDGARAREALEKAEFVVLQTSHLNASAEYADVVIPAPTLYEEAGSVTNLERRAQSLPRALKPMIDKMVPEAWRAFADIAKAMERPMRANALDKIRIQARSLVGDYADAFGRIPDEGLHLKREGRRAYQIAQIPEKEAQAPGLRMLLTPVLWLSGAYAGSAHHLADMPEAALALSPSDAGSLGVVDGELMEFEVAGVLVRLPAHVDKNAPVGVAFAPEGCLRAHGGSALNTGGAPGRQGVEIQVRKAEKPQEVGA